MNAQYALNAANARWGNLYDTLCYRRYRKTTVLTWANRTTRSVAAKSFLTRAPSKIRPPRSTGQVTPPLQVDVENGKLSVSLTGGSSVGLVDEELVGYWRPDLPRTCVRQQRIHFEIRIDRDHPIGMDDAAGVADVVLQSAITTIMDCEFHRRRGRRARLWCIATKPVSCVEI